MTAGILGMRYLGWIEFAELAAYDQLMQLKPDEPQDDRLLVVGITETDLQFLEEWPVSDRTLAQAIARLEQHQPQTIAVDIFRDFPHEPGTQELRAQIQQNSQTLIICKISTVNDLGTPPPAGVAPEQVGFADLVVDSGGILRRSLLMSGPPEPETPFPKQHQCNQPLQTQLALSLKAAMQYLAAQDIQAGWTEDQQLVLGSTVIPPLQPDMGGYRGADTAGYQVMLHYRAEKGAIPEVSLLDVLNDEVDPALIRDRIIFIGYTTPQAKDDFYTPYSVGKADDQKMPGVIVHAQSASQLLSNVLDSRPLIWGWSLSEEVLWIFVWAWAGGILGWYLRHPIAFAVAVLAACVVLYGLCLWGFLHGGWIPLVPPAMTFIGTAVGVVLLDRFNQSPYGRKVYRKVRNFLRLKIEIDEDKLEQQVSSITETDYFRHLEQKATTLRRSNLLPKNTVVDARTPYGGQLRPDANVSLPYPSQGASDPPPTSKTASGTGANTQPSDSVQGNELDFIQEINHKARQFRQKLGTGNTQASPNSHADPDSQADAPKHPTQPAHSTKQELSNNISSGYQSFVLDDVFCKWTDESAVTQDYVSELSKRMAALRLAIGDELEN